MDARPQAEEFGNKPIFDFDKYLFPIRDHFFKKIIVKTERRDNLDDARVLDLYKNDIYPCDVDGGTFIN